MAATDIKIIVSATTDQAQAAMRRIGMETNALTSSVRGVVGSIGGMVTALAGVASASAAISNVVQNMDDYKKSTIAIAASLTDTIRRPGADMSSIYKQNLKYAEETYNRLELASKDFFASGKEMVEAWEILSSRGVRVTSDEDIRNLGTIVDQVKILTKGQTTSLQISQEIRSVMNGQARVTDQLAMKLRQSLGPSWEYLVNKAVEEGKALKLIGDTLQGLKQASGDISKSWENQYSALTSIVSQLTRGGLAGFYNDIVEALRSANEYLLKHKAEIMSGMSAAYEKVKGVVVQIGDIVKTIYENRSGIMMFVDSIKGLAIVGGSLIAINSLVGIFTKLFGAGGLISGGVTLIKSFISAISGLAGIIATRLGTIAALASGALESAGAIGAAIGASVMAGIATVLNAAALAAIIGIPIYKAVESWTKNSEIGGAIADYAGANITALWEKIKDVISMLGEYIKANFTLWTSFFGNILAEVIDLPIAYWKDKMNGFLLWWVDNVKNAMGSFAPEFLKNGVSSLVAAKSKSEQDLANANKNYSGSAWDKSFAEYQKTVAGIKSTVDMGAMATKIFLELQADRNRSELVVKPPEKPTQPDAEASRNTLNDFLKTLTMMRQGITDDLQKAKLKPYDYERWKVDEDIRRAKIGSDINQPIIPAALEQVVREWAANGQKDFSKDADPSGFLKERYAAVLQTLQLFDQQRTFAIAEIGRKEREDEAKTVDAITQERERMQKSIADMSGTRLEQMREATDYELAQENKRITAIKASTEREIAAKKALLDDYAEYARKKRAEVELATGDNWGAGLGRGFKDFGNQLKSGFEYAKDLATSTAQAMSQSFGDFFFDVMTGKIKKLSDYITGFLTSIARAMANVMGEMAARQLITGAMGMFSSGTVAKAPVTGANGSSMTMNTPSLSMSGAGTSMASGYANGGLIEGGFRAFATGGVVSKPTLGLIGEGRYNEAVVPLPDGKALPVVMRGGTQQSPPPVTINIINQTGQPASARASQPKFDGLGRMIIDVVLDGLNRNVGGLRDAVGAV